MTPNPSVERTHNGGSRLFAPSRPEAPLRAAHVKRYAPGHRVGVSAAGRYKG